MPRCITADGRPFLATVNAADWQREEFVIKVSL
jgi:hypothetical protein